MKKYLFHSIVVLSFFILGCKKKTYDLLPALPAITETGADTFGCLANGGIFIPQDTETSWLYYTPALSATYQPFINNNIDQYNLIISAADENPNGAWRSVYIFVRNMDVTTGKTIVLKSDTAHIGAYGEYSSNTIASNARYGTTTIVNGELNISKIDVVNKFISGTFKFRGINYTKDTVNVTDGRFDIHYNKN